MTAVPAAIVERARPGAAASDHAPGANPKRGDVRVVRPLEFESGSTRLALVVDLDRAHSVADVVLIHTDPEMATSTDAVVPKQAAKSLYPLVVQTDVRATVWLSQLGPLRGHLDEDQIQHLNDAIEDGSFANEPGFAVGLPLDGPFDDRWSFKRSEGQELRRLSADCTSALLDNDVAWEIDGQILGPQLVAAADDPGAAVVELLHWRTTRKLVVRSEDRIRPADLTEEAWGGFRDVGVELTAVLADLAMNSPSLTDEPSIRRLLSAAGIDAPTEYDVIHRLGLVMEAA